MLRFLRTFAWLRWRLLANGLRGARRRDALEAVSRLAQVAVPAVLGGLVLVLASGLGILAYVGGAKVGAGTLDAGLLLLVARGLLLLVLLVMVLVPLGGAGHGAVAGSTRLLLLPVPARALHLIEVLTTLADPWLAVLVPPLLLFALGLLRAGQAHAAAVALAAGAAFLVLLAALGSLLSFAVNWLMRGRRRGEAFTLVYVLLISTIGLVPAFFAESWERDVRKTSARRAEGGEPLVGRLDAALPAWTRAIPSELYGRAAGAGLAGRFDAAWLGTGMLAAQAAVLYGLSAAAYRKLLLTPESGGGRRRGAAAAATGRRLPGLSPAASAVALVQARTALRSVRGRLGVMLPGPMVAVMALFARQAPDEFPGGDVFGAHGHTVFAGAVFCSLYTSLAFIMNQFAVDRAGLARWFLAPISPLDLVKGKAAGCALIAGAAALLGLVCALLVAPGGSPLAWLAVALGGVATYLCLMPFGVLLSGLFPMAADLGKTGSAGGPHGLGLLLGMLLIAVLGTPAGLILGIAHHLLGRPGLALGLMALWTVIAAAIALPWLRITARAVEPRRENLVLVAAGR